MSANSTQAGLLSSIFVRIFLIRDLFFGMYNIIFGRFNSTLLPRIPKTDLTGRVALITGGNSGIGLSVAKSLAIRGCTIYLGCRNLDKARTAATEIEDLAATNPSSLQEKLVGTGHKVYVFELDTSSFASVQGFVDKIAQLQRPSSAKIDFVYHNAGISGANANTFSEDGLDLTYQTNFLSSFRLTHSLLTQGSLAPQARIILTTSTGQYGGKFSRDFSSTGRKAVLERGFHCRPMLTTRAPKPSEIYSNSKAMQSAFARLLQIHFRSQHPKMQAMAFTPDYCSTPIFGKTGDLGKPTLSSDPAFYMLVLLEKLVAIPVEEGAATGVWLADADIEEKHQGGYWDRCSRYTSGADVLSDATLKRLWDRWCFDAEIEWNLFG